MSLLNKLGEKQGEFRQLLNVSHNTLPKKTIDEYGSILFLDHRM
jgi:hypothetical protein